jgi:hypothetical protein
LSGGNINFGPGAGTCVIDYNDPGTAVYAAATEVQATISVIVQVNGTYSGYSSTTLFNGGTYAFGINPTDSVANQSSHTANGLSVTTGTTLTKLTFTMSGTSNTTFTATVGKYTGGTWTATGLTCSVAGRSGSKTCSISLSQSITAGYSINLYVTGVSGAVTGTWSISYTQP